MASNGLSQAFVKAVGRREVFGATAANEFVGIRIASKDGMVLFADANGYVLQASVDDPRTADMLPIVQVDILTYGRANVVNPTLKRAADALREGTQSRWFAVGDDGETSTPIGVTYARPQVGETHISLEGSLELVPEESRVLFTKLIRVFLDRANRGAKPLDRRIDNTVYQAYRQQQASLRS